ncbi:Protein of unknown function [Pyronema omphalodes CBS 100304]|uniref:Uncharacterized protein n=1 Tax=Pyronema omphalodes (strain CBS 100304) TaxID=1076935 RepID=U4LQI3_PYROM|nr:Protein of unknown function [Pyronema omphalodes CBS 100304]
MKEHDIQIYFHCSVL